MLNELPESDWKVFRELRETALQRFCTQVLEDVQKTASDSSQSAHERYLALWQLMDKRDRELDRTFDNPRRSFAAVQLAVICRQGLLKPEEIARFSDATQENLSTSLSWREPRRGDGM